MENYIVNKAILSILKNINSTFFFLLFPNVLIKQSTYEWRRMIPFVTIINTYSLLLLF